MTWLESKSRLTNIPANHIAVPSSLSSRSGILRRHLRIIPIAKIALYDASGPLFYLEYGDGVPVAGRGCNYIDIGTLGQFNDRQKD